MSIKRTAIQVEADQIDLKIFRAIDQLEQLADRIPTAAAKLRVAAFKLRNARGDVRQLMHPVDREVTQ